MSFRDTRPIDKESSEMELVLPRPTANFHSTPMISGIEEAQVQMLHIKTSDHTERQTTENQRQNVPTGLFSP